MADTDEDGLSDQVESRDTGTDPLSTDTDNDGLDDGDELALGTDPNLDDTDSDGLLDGREAVAHKLECPSAPGVIATLIVAKDRRDLKLLPTSPPSYQARAGSWA